MRWIKRRTESLKLRPVKFSLKIVLKDHRARPCSVSQSTLPSSPAGNTIARTLHLLTALSGCWICKNVQNQAVDIYGFSSHLPLPHKTSSLKHWFPFMCPGTQGPCVELWLRSEQLHWWWCLELGFSVKASSDLKLCLVVGINKTFQSLSWYRVELFFWGYTALCFLRTWVILLLFFFLKKKKASCCSLLCQSNWGLFWKQQQMPSNMLFNFDAPKFVFLSVFFFPYRNAVWYYCTISGCSSVITFHSDSLPYLLFCFPLQHCVTVASMSQCKWRILLSKKYAVGVGRGRVVHFLLLSALHLHFLNSDQYNIC